jgi:hypothetical protein
LVREIKKRKENICRKLEMGKQLMSRSSCHSKKRQLSIILSGLVNDFAGTLKIKKIQN